MRFTEFETRLLNRIQKDMPLCRDFYASLARDIGSSADAVMSGISDLRERGIIRNISGIFNASSLGYESSLVAVKVPQDTITHAASVINDHPGVSHNYLRDHDYNIWFTITVPSDDDLERTVQIIAERAQAQEYLIFYNEELYKIGMILAIGQDDSSGNAAVSVQDRAKEFPVPGPAAQEVVRLLQIDLPLYERPFSMLIQENRSDIDEENLLGMGEMFKKKGMMRRYSAVLRHRKAGYRVNAMTAWRPCNEEQRFRAVEHFKKERAVSHLYLRTIYPGRWEHPIFAMIHARSEEELRSLLDELSGLSGIDDYMVLRSLQEFKKQRVKYFTGAFNEWKKGALL